jgi:DNA-binding response OmpR family regulator
MKRVSSYMKVLLIDDNKDINDMVCLCLETQDITVKVVDEGREGLRSIKENHFDVILLDLAMPGFSGFDIFKALKDEGLLASKNIVIFTASSVTDNEIQEMLLTGAKGILKKPISIDDLIETVERFRQDGHQ